MKRISTLLVMGLFFCGLMVFGQNYISFPTPDYRLCMGKTCEVTWDKNYFKEDGVKIVLYTWNKKRIKVIKTSEVNDGSCLWTVPKNLKEGDYRLYMRGLGEDTAPQHFGHVFKILNCGLRRGSDRGAPKRKRGGTGQGVQSAPALKYVDLRITKLWIKDGALKAMVDNKGTIRFTGMVDFALNVNGDDIFGYSGIPEGIHLNIPSNGYQTVHLPCLMQTIPANKTGRISLKSTVDSTNKIVELSDTNNTKETSFPWGVSRIVVKVERENYNINCRAGGYLKPKIKVTVTTNAPCTVKFVVNRGEGEHYIRGGGFGIQNNGPYNMTFSVPGSKSLELTELWFPIWERNAGEKMTWYVNARVTYPGINMRSRNDTFTTTCPQ